MIKKSTKIGLIALGTILLILILTNPSPSDFKNYIGARKVEKKMLEYRRTSNWLIFSKYEYSITTYIDVSKPGDFGPEYKEKINTYKYWGIFKNFIKKN